MSSNLSAHEPSRERHLESQHESEQLWKAVFESAIDAILIADDDGRYVSANPSACALLGLAEEDLLKRRVADFTAPALDFEQSWRSFLQQGHSSGEMELVRADGTFLQIEFSAISNVLPGRHLSILRDITSGAQAEKGLRLLAQSGQLFSESLDFQTTLHNVARLALPALADYCVIDIVSDEGRIERQVTVHSDPARQPLVEELRRFPPRWEDTAGTAAILHSGQSFLAASLPLEQIAAFSRDADHQRLLLALEPTSALIVPLIARERQLGIWSFVRSNGGRPYQESDLRLAETLARRAGLAIDNARLFREAELANQAKDQFLASLSHELRTPLTPVLALVSKLEGLGELTDELRHDLAVIRKNVELESRLIDDLLDLTRISRGKIELRHEVTDLHELLDHALQVCCPEERECCRLTVETELRAADARVWADGPRLTQVFWNLLSNAAKFTPNGGIVRVATRSEPEGAEQPQELVVEVSDTGSGIEPDLLPRIFDAFKQGPAASLQRAGGLSGLGLGLAISKAILELHGGSLSAESPGKDRGAIFTARIPVRREHFAASPKPQPQAPPISSPSQGDGERPLRILLVEDHLDTAEALADLLRARGHSVLVAGCVREGLATAERAGIDLVLSDLGLPDGSGLDLMRVLSRQGLPGIALSGYGMEEDVRRSYESGFLLHLTKPVTLQSLEEAIRKVLVPNPALRS